MSEQSGQQQGQGETIPFEEALARYQDLVQLRTEGQAVLAGLMKANEDAQVEARTGIALPGTGERLVRAQIALSVQLDKIAACIREDETDPLRAQVIGAVYQELSGPWTQIYIQTQIMRGSSKSPRYHEFLMQEAVLLLQRGQQPKSRIVRG